MLTRTEVRPLRCDAIIYEKAAGLRKLDFFGNSNVKLIVLASDEAGRARCGWGMPAAKLAVKRCWRMRPIIHFTSPGMPPCGLGAL